MLKTFFTLIQILAFCWLVKLTFSFHETMQLSAYDISHNYIFIVNLIFAGTIIYLMKIFKGAL